MIIIHSTLRPAPRPILPTEVRTTATMYIVRSILKRSVANLLREHLSLLLLPLETHFEVGVHIKLLDHLL